MCLGLREREDPRKDVTFKKNLEKTMKKKIRRMSCADREGTDALDRVHCPSKGAEALQSMAKK